MWTTLDLNMQRAADAAVRANAPKNAQGALVAIDRDGSVRAMVGGTDYVASIYNRSTQAVRQPGSAFKLFVYLAALEAGHKPEDSIVDEPVTINGWSPRNSSGANRGPMTLRTAFAYSVNTIAAKLGQEIGFGTIADMARRFGITTPVDTHPAMVLGTSDVRLIDMTRAFASVSQQGRRRHALWHHQGDRERRNHLRPDGRPQPCAGRALCGGRDDRPAPDRGQYRNRQGRPDRPPRRGQDRARRAPTRMAGFWAFRAA